MQMMEVPVLKTWIHSLVMDALATSFVDPGHLEINIHPSEVNVPETRPGDTLAQGVLTVIIWTQRGTSSEFLGLYGKEETADYAVELGIQSFLCSEYSMPLLPDSTT